MSPSRSSGPSGKLGRSRSGAGRVDLGPDSSISVVRTGLAALLVVLGIAWMVVYINVAQDGTAVIPSEYLEAVITKAR